jgi:predicted nucleic acid-binding protein
VKVCLDAPVLAAAFTTRGLCVEVLRLILVRHRLLASRTVLADVRRILTERLGVPAMVADQVPPFLREHAEIDRPAEPWPNVDIAQGWLLALAVDGRADLLVTHSRTLLERGAEWPLPVMDLRGCWQRMRTAASA